MISEYTNLPRGGGRLQEMIRAARFIYNNKKGWKTDRRIIVIESDDWGSIRMPSKKVYDYCLKKGYRVDKNIYTKYDSLASEDDLNLLFNVLIKFKDTNHRYPVITANCLVANPDFKKIKNSEFNDYHYELLTSTFNNYPKHQRNWQIWGDAIDKGLFFPQSHGREHLNEHRFLCDLRNGVEEAIFAFNLEMPGIFLKNNLKEGNNYVVPLEFYDQSDKYLKCRAIDDGLKQFEKIFGYKSNSFIAGNYVWDNSIERILRSNSVDFIQGSRYQNIPKGKYRGFVKKRHHLGEKNKYNQLYLLRNVSFEPSSFTGLSVVDNCLSQISLAFKFRRPAVIATHRVNYVGFIDEANRNRSLKLLHDLLVSILKKWPDCEFMTSVELGNLINSNKQLDN